MLVLVSVHSSHRTRRVASRGVASRQNQICLIFESVTNATRRDATLRDAFGVNGAWGFGVML